MKNKRKQNGLFYVIFCFSIFFIFSYSSGSSDVQKRSEIEKKVDAFLKAKDYNLALVTLDESIKQNPENPSLRALKVKVLAQMGDIIKATEEYLKYYNFTQKHLPELLREIVFGHFLNGRAGGNLERANFLFAFHLARFGDKSCINELKEFLKSEYEDLPFLSAQALAMLGDSSGIAILKEALRKGSPYDKNKAAVALAEYGDNSGIDILREGLGGMSRIGDRWMSAYALARLGDTESTALLKKALDDKTISWMQAAIALAKLGDAQAIAVLRKALQSGLRDEEMVEVVAVLSRIGDKNLIPSITQRLEYRINSLINMEDSENKYEDIENCVYLELILYSLTKVK